MSRITPLLAIGLLGGWSPLIAQSAPPASQPAFAGRVVVTATLEPEPVDRLAATVDVVDAEEIAAREATSALELLRTLPGVAAAQSGSPGKVASLFVRGAGSAATLVLLDGVPLNDPVLGAFDWSAVESAGLARVEVVRGPYSALWGSGAMGGVVQLLTRRDATPFAALRAEGGSRAARRGRRARSRTTPSTATRGGCAATGVAAAGASVFSRATARPRSACRSTTSVSPLPRASNVPARGSWRCRSTGPTGSGSSRATSPATRPTSTSRTRTIRSR